MTEKNYEPSVGTLLWSKFNGDRRLAGPAVDEMLCSLGDLIDMMAVNHDAFAAAVVAETSKRREAYKKPKKKQAEATSTA